MGGVGGVNVQLPLTYVGVGWVGTRGELPWSVPVVSVALARAAVPLSFENNCVLVLRKAKILGDDDGVRPKKGRSVQQAKG